MSKISKISARPILDSSGSKTIEVTVKTDCGHKGVASVPQGKSKGSGEVPYVSVLKALKNIKITERFLKGIDVTDQKKIDDLLLTEGRGLSSLRRSNLPKLKRNSSFLGGNVTVGVSMAVARAAAASQKVELWEYLHKLYVSRHPERSEGSSKNSSVKLQNDNKNMRLLINCIEGGAHAKNGPAFQEYLISPKIKSVICHPGSRSKRLFGIQNIKESIKIGEQFYKALKKYIKKTYGIAKLGDEGGFTLPTIKRSEFPGKSDLDFTQNIKPLEILKEVARTAKLSKHLDFGLDVAANNVKLTNKQLKKLYAEIIAEFPLFYLEDPFAEKRWEKMSFVISTEAEGGVEKSHQCPNKANEISRQARDDSGLYVIADDLTTTNPDKIKKAHQKNLANGVIIKPNQIGTITQALEAVSLARQYGWFVCVSHRGRETKDSFIADFAYAIGADAVKFGGFGQAERRAKYKRLLKIS
ncbi:MAG: hypothetical protein ABH822_00635 [Patescibacteria group bacterium]